jgi:hypothetical protein
MVWPFENASPNEILAIIFDLLPRPSFFFWGGGGLRGKYQKKMKIACSVGVGARKSLRRRGRGGRGRYRGVYENPLCDMFSPSPYKVLERSGS